MIRPTRARVDLTALEANFRAIVAHLARERSARGLQPAPRAAPARRAGRDGGAPPPGVIAVVKANAYGHGAGPVARSLEHAGADLVACADIEEGCALRSAGVEAEILVFGALSVSDLDGVFDGRLTPTISSPAAARALQNAAARAKRRLRYHLKIDTGMNRLGFRHDNLRRTLPEVLASPNLELEAVYTHFATADDPHSALFAAQRERFERALAEVATLGGAPRYRHAANSAALLRDPGVWYERVRPGLLLYGIVPPTLDSPIPLTPAMTLVSRVVAVKGVRAGETIGYGARCAVREPATVAIVPAGYADGLDTRLSGRGVVLIRGRRVPIVGSVCMDMLMADVSGLDVDPGDEVVILGPQRSLDGRADRIDACEMAASIGTIPYEILSRIGSRIERVYALREEGASRVIMNGQEPPEQS